MAHAEENVKREAEQPDAVYQYVPRAFYDPYHPQPSYGILGKQLLSDGWASVALVTAFSTDQATVASIAEQGTQLQLPPAQLLHMVQNYLSDLADAP